jgi:enoyl-CoA hydratase
MRSGLSIGAAAEVVWQVAAEHVIHLGYPPPSLSGGLIIDQEHQPAASAVVFSTPNMVLLMERAARKVLEPLLEPGEVSVGAAVQVEHLAGTPLGAEVRGVARVTSIDGRSIDFEIAAYDRHEQIGRGTHRRAVVRVERIAQRIADKATAAQQAPVPMSWLDGISAATIAQPDNSQNISEKSMAASTPASSAVDPLPVTSTLNVEIRGAVATVTLNRPDKKNAVNIQMTEDWEKLIRYLWHHREIRVVVVAGAGGAFCAGDDVPEVGTLSLQQAQELSHRQARVYLAWEQLPQIFVAAIGGVALGAGCVMACACDLRIASHSAQLGMPEILLGWPPGYGIAQLTALIGKGRAMEMCLLGEPITAQQAHGFGLVHQVVAAGTLANAAQKLADQLLALPAVALSETKRAVHADEGLQPKTAFVSDTAAYIRCLNHADAQEGIAAFKAKRKPRFPSTRS